MPAVDPARIGAQVVSGIGFLGAGTILLNNKNQVKGLTTAAGLWASACLGLAIGTGFYLAAVVGVCAIIMIETIMHKLSDKIQKNAPIINIYMEILSGEKLSNLIIFLKRNNIHIVSVEKVESNESSIFSYFFVLRINKQCKITHSEIIHIIMNSGNGITFCEEIGY
jgi:putative Mg2+ transporter-C (MgtC) family protein